MTESQGRNTRRRAPASAAERALLVALVALLGLRFAAIELDPPGGILSRSGAFLTDEGFYLKAATLHHAFGSWGSEHDPNWYVITPLYALLTVAMGYLFHPLLVPARYLAVACSAGSIAVFYVVCRQSRTRAESLVCCLLAATAFDNFAFSRLAFVEPMGTLFGLLALCFWVGWKGRCLWAAASCACAAAVMLTKLNLVYTPATVGLLWAWQAWAAWRGGDRRRALGVAGILAVTACVGGVVTLLVVSQPGEARHLGSSAATVAALSSLGDLVSHEATLFWNYPQASWRRALVLGALLGAAAWLARRFGSRIPSANPQSAIHGPQSARPLVAMTVWCGVGMAFLGAFEYQVPRWLYFTVYPFAYVAVSVLTRVVPPRRLGLVLGLLVAGHLLSQAPAVSRYVTRPPGTSLLDMARDVARRLERERPPIVLAGNCSYLVGIFSEHIRPIAGGQLNAAQALERFRRWRPAYLLANRSEFEMVRDACRGLLAAAVPVASYTVIANYLDGSDLTLFCLEYR